MKLNKDLKIALLFQLVILLVAALAVLFGAYSVYAQDSKAGVVEAVLIRVVDGDTLKVELNGLEETVRVLGINTPERGENGFQEAKEFTKKFLTEVDGTGMPRVILSGESGSVAILRDNFCRLLAYVHREQDGADLSSVLIASGNARVFTKYPCGRTAFYLILEQIRMQRESR